MVYKIRFGTDGWRGGIAREYTFLNVKRCAQGFAAYLINQGHKGKSVIVGYDKRFLSDRFAAVATEVLAGNGFKVFLTHDATPTPVISYAVVAKDAVGAVNITASHNPPQDNGFKVRDEHGGAVPPEGLTEIETLIPEDENSIKEITIDEAIDKGFAQTFDASLDYIEHLKTLIDLQPIKDAGLTVLVDAMWGNGAGWFTRLLDGGKTKVIEVNNTLNPAFPGMLRPEPIPPNINHGLRATIEHNADVLLVNDGDADRLGVGDENGEFVNQLRVYGLLALYLLEVRGERGPIVKTLSTTNMLHKLGNLYNVEVYDTGVGFKYVAPKMLEVDAMIGGEESGGYAFRGNVPERDGILAGLYFLDMMVKLNKKPTELLDLLFAKVGPHYYDRIDTVFSGDREERKKMIIHANPETIGGFHVTGLDTLDGYKFNLEDGGWLLIRFSGTEPKLRVYCETTSEDKVQDILEDGLRIAGIK
jgi:phosphomannomutase